MIKSLLQHKIPPTSPFTPPYSSTLRKEEKLSSKYDFLQNLISQYELQIQQNISFHKKVISQSPVVKSKLQPQSTSHHHQDTQDKTSLSLAFRKKGSYSLDPKDDPQSKLNQSLEESHNTIRQKYTFTVKIQDNQSSEISVLTKKRQETIEVMEFEELSAKRQPEAQLDEENDSIPLVESLILPEEMVHKSQTKASEPGKETSFVSNSQFQQVSLQTSAPISLNCKIHPNQPINPCYIVAMCFIFLLLLMLCI